jgi:hypothetical protein
MGGGEVVDDVMEKVALTPWATRWEDVFALEVTPKLVVVWASSAAEARRESGMIDHEFFPATPDDVSEWEDEAGVSATAVSLRSPDHYRATVLALVRGKLDAALGHDDEEADDGEEGDDDADA